ncbi:MAG TPA: HAD-IA family hydrolase [Catenuloplanes sp.]|jgi:putative hydrolase of the HAD superfamily
MRRQRARALLVDLDGVLRRFDPAVAAAVEFKYGLDPGELLGTALDWPRLRAAVTGAVPHVDWMAEVAEVLAERVGGIGNARAAVSEWQAYRGEVDHALLDFLREVRATGLPVGLATNSTDRLDADLATLGLNGEFDVVVNSSVIGVHKPAPEFYARACEAVGVPPEWVLFVDDDDRAVRGARAARLPAYRWTGAHGLPYVRAALAIDQS